MIRFAPAGPADAFELELRPEDALEVSPGWRKRLADSIEEHGAVAARDLDGRLVALYGAVSGDTHLCPWLLCDESVKGHRRTTARVSVQFVRSLRKVAAGRPIFNFIPRDSTGNRAFVEALGFRIVPLKEGLPDLFYLPESCVNLQPSSP